MAEYSIYKDIAERTGGDIYIGVVGPVRSGKSTFIKRFLETSVIPHITNEHERARARDELPQSAGGKTVMTTEPKFIPDESVEVVLNDSVRFKVKMVDCVGYMIPQALGNTENGEIRMVHTPWSVEPMPFEVAAEMGTQKVIREHATIGMLVTSDGSIGEIPRSSYEIAEKRIVKELKEYGKPFVVILNTSDPFSEAAEQLAIDLEKEYEAPVALLNCLELNEADVCGILEMVLMEFPVRELQFSLPNWIHALDESFWLVESLNQSILSAVKGVCKMGDVSAVFSAAFCEGFSGEIEKSTGIKNAVELKVGGMDMGLGTVMLDIRFKEQLYFHVISELTGIDIEDDCTLLSMLCQLADIKEEYDKFALAIEQVEENGYGIVMPGVEDMKLEEPTIIKQTGGYGIRLRASAPSIHMIRAGIETEINPIVGTEQQSEELVHSMLRDFEEDPQKIWESHLFGKSLYDLVNEGLHTKLLHMPAEAREKMGETLSRIINEGSNGLICIIL